MQREQESGFALLALLVVIVPLFLIVLSSQMAIQGETDRIQATIKQEKALLAAEAGLDYAISLAGRGLLSTDSKGAFSGNIAGDDTMRYDIEVESLLEETGEEIFKVSVRGEYGKIKREVVAYLGNGTGDAELSGALTVYNNSTQITVDFASVGYISGNNTKIDGTGSDDADAAGIAIAHPGVVADFDRILRVDQPSRVTGLVEAPSYDVDTKPLDLAKTIQAVKSTVTRPMNAKYDTKNWGSRQVLYRKGDLDVADVTGSGILVVTGDLTVKKHFSFTGLVIVLGDIDLDGRKGTILIHGGLIQGESGTEIRVRENVRIRYSTEALRKISILDGSSAFVTFNGWQEVGR